MADFGELCPLFSTGVFNEVTFPYLPMTGVSVGVNALFGTITASHAGGGWKFGRTVVVTGAFIRRMVTSDSGGIQNVTLMHFSSQLAAGTAIGTLTVTVTSDGFNSMTWVPMSVAAVTFVSSDVLGFSMATGTALSAGTYDLIVRYKEK
jgi:hypothetical protein